MLYSLCIYYIYIHACININLVYILAVGKFNCSHTTICPGNVVVCSCEVRVEGNSGALVLKVNNTYKEESQHFEPGQEIGLELNITDSVRAVLLNNESNSLLSKITVCIQDQPINISCSDNLLSADANFTSEKMIRPASKMPIDKIQPIFHIHYFSIIGVPSPIDINISLNQETILFEVPVSSNIPVTINLTIILRNETFNKNESLLIDGIIAFKVNFFIRCNLTLGYEALISLCGEESVIKNGSLATEGEVCVLYILTKSVHLNK